MLCFSFWWEYRNHSWPGNHPELQGSWFNVKHKTHIFQPSWCRHGLPWDNICQWDILSTGDESFLSMYCWYVVPEPLKWVEIFRRCHLHQCYFEVCNWKFLKPTLKTSFSNRQVVVLTWWSCWSLENEFFYFQVRIIYSKVSISIPQPSDLWSYFSIPPAGLISFHD